MVFLSLVLWHSVISCFVPAASGASRPFAGRQAGSPVQRTGLAVAGAGTANWNGASSHCIIIRAHGVAIANSEAAKVCCNVWRSSLLRGAASGAGNAGSRARLILRSGAVRRAGAIHRHVLLLLAAGCAAIEDATWRAGPRQGRERGRLAAVGSGRGRIACRRRLHGSRCANLQGRSKGRGSAVCAIERRVRRAEGCIGALRLQRLARGAVSYSIVRISSWWVHGSRRWCDGLCGGCQRRWAGELRVAVGTVGLEAAHVRAAA